MSGSYAVWINFNPQRMTQGVYSSNPNLDGQAASQSQNNGTRLSHVSAAGTKQPQEGFTNWSALPDDFKLWLSRHPGLTIEEALPYYREEQKTNAADKDPNYTTPNAAEGSRPRRRFSSNLLSGLRGERISLYHICFSAYSIDISENFANFPYGSEKYLGHFRNGIGWRQGCFFVLYRSNVLNA